MKILLATDLYTSAVNGVVTSTVSLKKSLESLGHEVRVLTLGEIDYVLPDRSVYAMSSLSINKIYPGARVRLFNDRPILREIIRWNPDVIHTQSEFSTFRMAKYIAHLLNIPIVHTYHTIYEDYTHYFSPSKKTGKKIVSLISKKILSSTEEVIVPTEKVARLLNSYHVDVPVTVIPTGIELDKFQDKPSKEELVSLKRQYNIPKDAFLLVSIGRLGKEKNIEEIISFLSMIKLKPYLLIVGDGPNRYHLEELVKDLELGDRVKFTGMIHPNEVPKYYHLGNVFVCASTSETQGLTYIEALASGLPALAREDESIQHVIIKGKTGFQYRNFKEFEAYLYTLMTKKEICQEMSHNATKITVAHYSSEAFGQHVNKIYERALATHYEHQMMQMN